MEQRIQSVSQSSKNDLTFRNYQWKSKNGFISLKNIEYTHLIQIIRTVRLIAKEFENNICGMHRDEWVKAIKAELKYRDQIADSILMNFKGHDGVKLTDHVRTLEKGFYYDESKKKMIKVLD